MRRSLVASLVAAAAAVGLVAAPSPASAATNAAVCAIVGSVSLTPGIDATSTTPTSGSFTFGSTVLVCAGTVTGTAAVSASGSFDNLNAAGGTFGGSFDTTAFSVTGQTCSGDVGGTIASVPTGVRVLGLVVASLTNVDCGGSASVGATVLTFIPDPEDDPLGSTDTVVERALMQGAAAFAG